MKTRAVAGYRGAALGKCLPVSKLKMENGNNQIKTKRCPRETPDDEAKGKRRFCRSSKIQVVAILLTQV